MGEHVETRTVGGRRGSTRLAALVAAATLVGLSVVGAPATAQGAAAPPPVCEDRVNDTFAELLACVTLEGVREHQAALQTIANRFDGTRAAGYPGYRASVGYVVDQLQRAGYDPQIQEFPFERITDQSKMEQVEPTFRKYHVEDDFFAAEFSPEGEVQAPVQAVDLVLPPGEAPNTSTSGCELSDFRNFEPGNIALIQRGTCTFVSKARRAQIAGASGVIIFNEGQPGRTDALVPAGSATDIEIPVVFTTFAVGQQLANTPGAVVRIDVNVLHETVPTWNVIAELPGQTDEVVMLGSHLDSVLQGPGINDNGSGSSAVLETAIMMQNVRPLHTVRFAWWGAEESGLLGSIHYVENLSNAEIAEIAMYMNYDMIGSPNFARFVYDGDGDTFGTAGPDGSDEIEAVYHRWYDRHGLFSEDTAFSGRSDYGPFIAAGIPSGGLFTGAEGIKTPVQEQRYGGEAGVAYDPCYHQACDTVDNVNLEVLDQNSDLVAFAALFWAMEEDLPGGDAAPTATALVGHGHES
jgi:Zn-dependent M28 family amino/carboxypeptidase